MFQSPNLVFGWYCFTALLPFFIGLFFFGTPFGYVHLLASRREEQKQTTQEACVKLFASPRHCIAVLFRERSG